MEKKEENILESPKDEELKSIKGPQKIFKFYATKIAEKDGFKVKEYEPSILGGKADVLAINKDNRLFIECCSCRINKAVDYLSKPNTFLWIMLKNFTDKITIFEVSRGKKWTQFKKYHDRYTMNQISKYYNKLTKFTEKSK